MRNVTERHGVMKICGTTKLKVQGLTHATHNNIIEKKNIEVFSPSVMFPVQLRRSGERENERENPKLRSIAFVLGFPKLQVHQEMTISSLLGIYICICVF